MASSYYNEIEPAAAHVIECLIKDGIIADGIVDRRSIVDVKPSDLVGFAQCHFFAGGALWSVALRQAGWPDDREVWTGSCPCQPLSCAGHQKGHADERHLWPAFHSLISERKPAIVFGEQVASKLGREWFSGVRLDMEALGYACGAADLCAAGVGAPHIRQRLYWVAKSLDDANISGRQRHISYCSTKCGENAWNEFRNGSGRGDMANAGGNGFNRSEERDGAEIEPGQQASCGNDADGCGVESGCMADADKPFPSQEREQRSGELLRSGEDQGNSAWSDAEWLTGADGKARRVKPGVCLLVDGLPGRVHALRLAGNAIVPPLASEFIKAVMETA